MTPPELVPRPRGGRIFLYLFVGVVAVPVLFVVAQLLLVLGGDGY